MDINTNKWLKNFNKEIKSVQVMFDAMLLPGKLYDYYEIKVNDGSLHMILSSENELPKPVVDVLYTAFDNSLPHKM